MSSAWYAGNANDDATDHRGWLVGHFMSDGDLRQTKDVEIKWGIHPAGDNREAWQGEEYRTTVLVLISGRFRIRLSEGEQVLERQGDYVMWGPGIGHSWHAEHDSVVVTVRWPSAP
jgi:hypothetical protein